MGNILVVDDEKDIRELIGDILRDEGHSVRLAWNAESALFAINEAAPDLIILDIWLKDSNMDGIDILGLARRDNPDIPVVIISGHGNIEIAVAAVKQGAYDFIEKPFNIDQLVVVVGRALEASSLRRENAAFRNREVETARMIGESSSFRALRQNLDKVALSNSRVLLTGPAGSGKEVAARYIHANGSRAAANFVSVNCASIVPDRMEEVLFGRESADRGHEPGLLERAHGGVLFLDEVADMPYMTQSKMLRVLVDQTFTRLGGADTVRVDVRVISATNKDLLKEIYAGRFREELYHRLNVVPIEVPDLSARKTDIPLLCDWFVRDLNRTQGLPSRVFSEEILLELQLMDWPGNIRQLRNTVERMLILGSETGNIGTEELPGLDKIDPERLSIAASFSALPLRDARELFEREYLKAQIDRFSGNISKTAQFVGMERSALHRKLKNLEIDVASRTRRLAD